MPFSLSVCFFSQWRCEVRARPRWGRYAPYPSRLFRSIITPIKRMRKYPVSNWFFLFSSTSTVYQLVTLLPVTSPMCKLHVIQIRWVSTFRDWNNMIYTWRQWMWILEWEVHRLSTYSTHSLGCINLFLILFKSSTVGSIFIWSIPLQYLLSPCIQMAAINWLLPLSPSQLLYYKSTPPRRVPKRLFFFIFQQFY